MIHLWERNLFHLAFLGLIAYYILESFSFTKSEFAALPLIVGIPTFIILVFNLLGENFTKLTKIFESSIDNMLKGKESDVQTSFFQLEEDIVIDNRQLIYFSAWLLILGVTIYFVGFLISVPVFSFLYGIIIVRFSIWRSLIVTLIPTLMLIAASLFLKSALFKGVIFGGWVPAL